MLIRFEVENFRSILDPVELSMVAIDERPTVRKRPHIGASLLPVAGIFGPNASGKSNLLSALEWLRTAIAVSLRRWDEEIPVDPFAFGGAQARDSSFVLELEIEGIQFEYLLDIGKERVSYEALFHYPEGRRRRIFEREGNDLKLQRGLGQLSGTRSLLTDRTLALSVMRRFDEPLTASFAYQAVHLTSFGVPQGLRRRPRLRSARPTLEIFDVDQNPELDLYPEDDTSLARDSISTREQALSLLKLADLGIADVAIETDDQEDSIVRPSRLSRKTAQLIHSSNEERLPFDFQDESAGTQTWFELIGPLLLALQRGRIVLFDELDSSLHPSLTSRIVDLFTSRQSNRHGAQLVFTAHDTNLLNQLNRDEVWLTQKLKNGSTNFGALSDFAGSRVRRSANLESGYLSGRFGALPDVSKPEVLRDLGLI